MKFTRDNFELYVMDYLEGKLSDNDHELFLHFLKENPDLSYEMEEVLKIKLQPGFVKFQGKNILRKHTRFARPETEFENLCIAFLEGDLDLKEKEKFELWLTDNPEKLIEFELFRKSRLEPDKSLLYRSKSGLKRLTITQKRIRLVTAISAAAVIILAIILFTENRPLSDRLQTQKTDKEIIIQPGIEESEDRAVKETEEFQYADNQLIESETITGTTEALAQNSNSTVKLTHIGDDYLLIEKEQIKISPVSPVLASIENKNASYLNKLKNPEVNTAVSFDKYQTIAQFAGNRILGSILPDYDSIEQVKITFWQLASAGFEELNQISDGGYVLDKEVNQKGKLKRISIETPLLGISIPFKSKMPQ